MSGMKPFLGVLAAMLFALTAMDQIIHKRKVRLIANLTSVILILGCLVALLSSTNKQPTQARKEVLPLHWKELPLTLARDEFHREIKKVVDRTITTSGGDLILEIRDLSDEDDNDSVLALGT